MAFSLFDFLLLFNKNFVTFFFYNLYFNIHHLKFVFPSSVVSLGSFYAFSVFFSKL